MMTAKMTANAEKRGKMRSGVKPSSMPEKHTSTGSMICAICDIYKGVVECGGVDDDR